MNKSLTALCFFALSSGTPAAQQALSEVELDSVAAGGATASAAAEAIGVEGANTSTSTYTNTGASSPQPTTGPARNAASALLSGFSGGATTPAPGTPQFGSTSRSSSSVNTNVVQSSPKTAGNAAAILLQQSGFGSR